jgi:hypothetical protein
MSEDAKLAIFAGWVSLIALALWLACTGAFATWKPEYAQADPAVQNWYRAAMVTPTAQKRLHFAGCCDDSDIVHTHFTVDRSSGDDQWMYEKDGHWVPIPGDIVHWDEHAPDGKPVLFALSHDFMGNPEGTLTCFYPPDSGQ